MLKSYLCFIRNSFDGVSCILSDSLSWGSLLFDAGLLQLIAFRDHSFSSQPDLLGYVVGNSKNEIFLPSLLSPQGIQVHRSSEGFHFTFWQWTLSMEPDSPRGKFYCGKGRGNSEVLTPSSSLDSLEEERSSRQELCFIQEPHFSNVDIYMDKISVQLTTYQLWMAVPCTNQISTNGHTCHCCCCIARNNSHVLDWGLTSWPEDGVKTTCSPGSDLSFVGWF